MKKLPQTNQKKADELCKRCGRCCQEKILIRGRVYALPSYCKWFDERTRLCKIYHRRHELNPQCLDVEMGTKIGVFPADCPYVADISGYVPPVEGVVDEETLRDLDTGRIATAEELEQRIRELEERNSGKSRPD